MPFATWAHWVPDRISVQWPEMLWLLGLVPLLAWWLHRRTRRLSPQAIRFPGLVLVRAAGVPAAHWRRRVPVVLLFSAFVSLLIGLARPAARVMLPVSGQTVVMAMDVSLSMRADDVLPNRLVAAQQAARAFLREQVGDARIGVVAFAGTAAVVQAATSDRQAVMDAIDRFQLQRGTAMGSGLLMSLGMLFADVDVAQGEGATVNGLADSSAAPGARAAEGAQTRASAQSSEAGAMRGNSVIVLLSDGQSTMGPDPLEIAQMAADRGVRVFTVGVGTPDGEIVIGEGWRMKVRLDEETLRGIASRTGGEYFYAGDAESLRSIYEALNERFVLEPRQTEVTFAFAALALLLGGTALILSVRWNQRLV